MLNSYTGPTTLIVAGAWNPDILSPQWVAREAMGLQLGANFQVSAQLPIGNPTQRPTFGFENIQYTAARNALTFILDQSDLGKVELGIRTAAKILGLLSHTPVTGFGFNFSFDIPDPSAPLLHTFSSGNMLPSYIDDENAQIVSGAWKTLVKTGDCLLSLDAVHEGGSVSLMFNVHTEVGSASEASEKLSKQNLFADTQQIVVNIAQHLHDMEER